MRSRFNRYSLCSHTTPDGQSYTGQQEQLRKKFEKGTITREELRAYCLMMHSTKPATFTVNGEISFDIPKSETKFKTITVWGKDIKVTIEEYNRHCAKLNL